VTTNRSFQPRPLPTLRFREFLVWVVMAFSGSAQGVESLSAEWRRPREKCDVLRIDQ
jgi:hypothetical protein